MTKKTFGLLPDGSQATLYTIQNEFLTASITDLGATLVSLLVPDPKGEVADVVLGYDDPAQYVRGGNFFGATVGRYANRIKGGTFMVGDKKVTMDKNEGNNNLHSGYDYFKNRLWTLEDHKETSIRFSLLSPDGDQGFPGNAQIHVTYSLENSALKISYDAVCDQDTVFNLTNHSYFNVAGHDNWERGGKQILSMPARFIVAVDDELIPTGELPSVEGTAFDFREPKAINADFTDDFGGYDNTFEVYTSPCAILTDSVSGRSMAVYTDCPGVQLYSSPGMNMTGKGGTHYGDSAGLCLETQYYPDSVNHPEWPQPFVKAGERYHSETVFKFN
jgi:aldose 1-epimerase